MFTFDKVVDYLLNIVLNEYKINEHHLGNQTVFSTPFFGKEEYYKFFSKFLKTYHFNNKNQLKKYLFEFSWLKTKEQHFIVTEDYKNYLKNLGNNLKNEINNTISSINSSSYLSSVNNIETSLFSMGHYMFLTALEPNPLTKRFQLNDFDFLTSSLIDFLPNWNWKYSNGTPKKPFFYHLEEKTRSSLVQEINKLEKTEIAKILRYSTFNLPKSTQSIWANIITQIKYNLSFANDSKNPSKWISHWPSLALSNIKNLISKANNIIKNYESNKWNTSESAEAKKQEINRIQHETIAWMKYINKLKPLLLIQEKDIFYSWFNKINSLHQLLIEKNLDEILEHNYNYIQYVNLFDKFKTLVTSFDIFDKGIFIKSLPIPSAKLIVNFKPIKDISISDENINIDINDIDLYTLSQSSINLLIQPPYSELLNVNNIKITSSENGTKALVEYEISLIDHPVLKDKKLKRTINLIASSRKFALFNQIKKKQTIIEKWLKSNNITIDNINKDFSFLKNYWDSYFKNKITIFDNSKDELFYNEKLKTISDLDSQLKKNYLEYLEKLKKQLINQFNSQYDQFISTLNSLKEKKYDSLIKKFKSLIIDFGNKKYIVYAEKAKLVSSMSIKENDYKIASIDILRKYINILEGLNKQLNDEIDRVKRLFDISSITLDILLNDNTKRAEIIEAFQKNIPFSVNENIDFILDFVKSKPGVPGFIKFTTKNETKLIGELFLELPNIKKDISKLDLNLKITNKTSEETIIRRFIQVLGFNVSRFQDFDIKILKATKGFGGNIFINGFGQKIYGLLNVPIPQLKIDDISGLDLDLDLLKEITENDVIAALIKKLGFDVEKDKDFKISIKQPTKDVVGLIKITALDTKITGELLINIPPKNLPIDLSKLKLDIESSITWYTPIAEIIKSFNRTLGFIPKIDEDYRIHTTNTPFVNKTLDGAVTIVSANTRMFSNYLELKFNRPKTINISALKSKWPFKITQNTKIDYVVNEFINLIRSSNFIPEKNSDFSYTFTIPTKENEKGYIQFEALPNSPLIGKLRLDIIFVDKEEKTPEVIPTPEVPTPKPIPKNPKTDSNFLIKIIAGTLTSLIFLGLIIAIAFVFIKTKKYQVKIDLGEEKDE